MRNIRKDQVYQCLAVDLTMLGVISKEECEMLIGCGIPNYLVLPNNSKGNIISESDLPEQPVNTDDGQDDGQDGQNDGQETTDGENN